VIEGTGNRWISILSDATWTGRIMFWDPWDANAWQIRFAHSLDTLYISTPAGDRVSFDDSGMLIDGYIRSVDGTALIPVISFINDPDTWIYRPWANALTITTWGVGRFTVDSAWKHIVNTPTSWTALEVNLIDNTASWFVVQQGGNSYLDISTANGSEAITIGNTWTDPDVNIDTDGTTTIWGDLSLTNWVLTIQETTTPWAETNFWKVYTKADNKLYFQDGAWTEHEIAFV
jgi:hypothetical protein